MRHLRRPENYDYVVIADLTQAQSVKNQLLANAVAEEKLVTFFADGQSRAEGESQDVT